MGVERQVVGRKREIRVEQRLEAAALAGVDDERLVPPPDPVVDDQQLRARRRRGAKELERRGDSADEPGHLARTEHLHSRRPVLPVGADVEQLVGEGEDLVAAGHRRILGCGR
jgi:hypothetical protein